LIPGIAGSNPGEDVDFILLCFLYVVKAAAFAKSWSLVQGSSTECVCQTVWGLRTWTFSRPDLGCCATEKKIVGIIQCIVTSLDIIFEKDKFNLPEFALPEGQSFLPGVPVQRRLDNASARTLKPKEIFGDLKYATSFEGESNNNADKKDW